MLRLIVKRLALLFAISFLWEAWQQRNALQDLFRHYDVTPKTMDDFQSEFVDEIKRTHPWMVEGAMEEIISYLNLHGYSATCNKYDRGVVDEIISRENISLELDRALSNISPLQTNEENSFQREEIRAEQAIERHLEDGSRDSL